MMLLDMIDSSDFGAILVEYFFFAEEVFWRDAFCAHTVQNAYLVFGTGEKRSTAAHPTRPWCEAILPGTHGSAGVRIRYTLKGTRQRCGRGGSRRTDRLLVSGTSTVRVTGRRTRARPVVHHTGTLFGRTNVAVRTAVKGAHRIPQHATGGTARGVVHAARGGGRRR